MCVEMKEKCRLCPLCLEQHLGKEEKAHFVLGFSFFRKEKYCVFCDILLYLLIILQIQSKFSHHPFVQKSQI